MQINLEELYRLHSLTAPPHIKTFENITSDYNRNNSLSRLFRDLIAENLPWSSLLLSHKYTLYPLSGDSFNLSDFGFFGAVVKTPFSESGLIENPDAENIETRELQEVSFPIEDPRIAGSLTTARFFNRYTNTALNKNRRRAAAVFRIFLCDSMEAAINPSINDDSALDRVLPTNPSAATGHQSVNEAQLLQSLNNDSRHGTQTFGKPSDHPRWIFQSRSGGRASHTAGSLFCFTFNSVWMGYDTSFRPMVTHRKT